jgi:hypothetical protein
MYSDVINAECESGQISFNSAYLPVSASHLTSVAERSRLL